jgi:hypothetical protein
VGGRGRGGHRRLVCEAGLGYLIIYAQYSFLIPQMYFGILAITVLGVACNHALVGLERRFARWRPTRARLNDMSGLSPKQPTGMITMASSACLSRTCGIDRGAAWLATMCWLAFAVAGAQAEAPGEPEVVPPPAARDWADLAKLPDWSGVWLPDPKHRNYAFGSLPPKWTPAAAAYIAEQKALDKAGEPNNLYVNCLPEGMPSFIIMTRNASEFLFTPGRVTILNEFDGNRLRRIYTDGRPHPKDPEPTFNGHSIGRWEGDVLVVDTVAILPQAFVPIGQSVGIPNNGDLHIVERVHLAESDRLEDDLVIEAPRVLVEPWKITKSFVRSRKRSDEIVEASCRQGDFRAEVDSRGNHVFVLVGKDVGGARLPANPR